MEQLLLKQGDNENQPYRELPANISAEQQLLGALLINNENITHIGDFLEAAHFFEPVHQRIYEAITKYFDRGIIANPVTLKAYFDRDEALAELGGAHYLVKIASLSTSIISVRDYGHVVYDLALKRNLIGIGEEIVNTAFDQNIDTPATGQIETAEQKLYTLANQGTSERAYMHLTKSLGMAIERMEKAYRNPNQVSGVSTGFTDLDRMLGGLQNSDLLILAGRPSMGKTALGVCLTYNVAKFFLETSEDEKKTRGVAFFSLEMSAEQVAARMLSAASNINSTRLRKGDLSPDDFDNLVLASRELSHLNYYVDDTPALSVSALRTRARRMKRMHNISLIVVDYLQLMRSTSEQAKTNRVLEISEITQGLKALAKELDLPVIALSQLSRAVEQRDDKRPQLSDLRESGSIEQDADIVMFVFREEYYLLRRMPREDTKEFTEWQEEMNKVHGTSEVIIAKQRNGPVGTAKLSFHSETAKFGNLAMDGYMPGGFE